MRLDIAVRQKRGQTYSMFGCLGPSYRTLPIQVLAFVRSDTLDEC